MGQFLDMAQVNGSAAGTTTTTVGAVVALALPLGRTAPGVTTREVVGSPEHDGLRALVLALLAPRVEREARALLAHAQQSVLGHSVSSCGSWCILRFLHTQHFSLPKLPIF